MTRLPTPPSGHRDDAVPTFTAPDGTELPLAHSAGGDLALLHAARHPRRVRSLAPIAARARALGVDLTEEHHREAVALRAGEPWFPAAYRAYEAVWTGEVTDDGWDAVAPFFYGRWDGAARAHPAADAGQSNYGAADRYAAPGFFDPAATRGPGPAPYGAVTVSPPRRGEAKASRSSRVSPVSRATSAVSRAPQSMPRSR
ncbi:hypothetical protein EES42_18425 [Streptomyces sp. ADI95-17]|nr:hypothetical protein EES42_18425 [Streptomyces sp. ADI95-17]